MKVHTLAGDRYNYITFILIDFFSRASSYSLIKEDSEKKDKENEARLSILSRLGHDLVN